VARGYGWQASGPCERSGEGCRVIERSAKVAASPSVPRRLQKLRTPRGPRAL
jgi:hypothetical protein